MFGKAGPKVWRTPATVDRYIDPLPIPARMLPYGTRGDTTLYRVRMSEVSKQLHSQLPPTKLWGYEGQYPGPTIEAMRNRPVEILWENGLPTQHMFPVDRKIHGAMAPVPEVRTVPHLHGARTNPESDGLPERWFASGESALYRYPNEQRSAALWYHDHAVGITRLNVYAGLAGFYLLRDEQELGLHLPTSPYEIPLVLQDRSLDAQGQLVYEPTNEDGTSLPLGVWGPEFFGKLPLVNGALYPHLKVEPRSYRFRLLNAANSRFFQLYFNLATSPTDIPDLITFDQIGSDGGLLSSPAKLQKLLLSPGERADIVIDFSHCAGRTLTFSNSAATPFPGWGMLQNEHATLSELMQIRVSDATPVHAAPLLFKSGGAERLSAANATVHRDLILTEQMNDHGQSLGVRIDGKGYDDPTTEFPKIGSLEKWRFINMTDDAHPMHLHLVQFQVLERQGFDFGAMLKGKLKLVGDARATQPNEAGWKDTAVVLPKEVLTLLVPFDGYTGRYVYHCHMLEHEDNDMMRPFEVVAVKA
jgi:spore coat protein A